MNPKESRIRDSICNLPSKKMFVIFMKNYILNVRKEFLFERIEETGIKHFVSFIIDYKLERA